jgi:uncharacterized coiled-coil protein SlyX
MKAILYVVVILVAGGAAFFSMGLSKKFATLEAERVEIIAKEKKATADSDVADQKIKGERKLLAESQERQELLTQSVSSLSSTATSLANDLIRLDGDLKVQEDEFAELNKALEEVNTILADLGGGVTLDTLSEKIQQIQDDKTAKQQKLEELETIVVGAKKSLEGSRAEMDRLTKRMVERSARIGRNSLEAVVTSVNQDWGFVVIGAGSNSGFVPQTTLIVQRDGRMIGRVIPSAVEPTQTIAEVDFKNLPSGVRIQPGDRVILSKPTSN